MNTNKIDLIKAEVERIQLYTQSEVLKQVLDYIDEVQKEPVSEDLEKAAKDYVTKEAVKDIGGDWTTVDILNAFNAGANWQKTKEELVSEDLEEACEQLAENARKHKAETLSPFFSPTDYKQGVIDGAKWQKEKDKESIETAIHHAYHNGRLEMKEQMMAKAIDGDITFDYYDDDDKIYGCIAHDSFCLEDFGLKDRDKVKVIVIKED